jgi:malate dehydrogenase (oxaloacetate-decarboxylating)(NADP+)
MATGRSDFDNQVNNVLGFPFLFKGALEAKAKQINNDMLIAAANALALLAKEPVPQSVLEAYGVAELNFGPNYIIPKPFDPRLIEWVAKAVKEAYKEDK